MHHFDAEAVASPFRKKDRDLMCAELEQAFTSSTKQNKDRLTTSWEQLCYNRITKIPQQLYKPPPPLAIKKSAP